mgnify:CR=1 FL=1|tara:strand:+ start:91509 stop:92594 length:1086 start_codon:yes stop_codon:yes gene_type:complete
MRIPSQFNDDSLYRGRKRPATAGGPSYRRLFRLFIALVLVVLVMKEAARPQLYETFFGDSPETTFFAGSPERIAADAARPTGGLQQDDQRPASGTQAGFTAETSPGPADKGDEVNLDDTNLDDTNLDELLSHIVDGSVWHGDDFQPLCYLLAHAHEVDHRSAASVSVLPLLQQPDVYRGQPVRFDGTIMRSELVTAAENNLGITEYWNLWMLPADKGERPLLAVVRDVPAEVASIGDSGKPVKAMILGRFFKRLAYRSSIGADLAPVIVGSLMVRRDETTPAAAPSTDTAVSKSKLVGGIALACALGLALAGLTMWRTSVSARRARELRQANTGRSAIFLRELSEDETMKTETDSNEGEIS